MRRFAALAAFSFAAVTVLGGARGANLTGTPGPDRLVGTPAADAIRGQGGDDRLDGRDGADLLDAGRGSDRIVAGRGDDRVATSSDGYDAVSCGPGRDVVTADRADAVADDCEVVSRELSRDRYVNQGAQHATEVEPDSFSWGSTIVATFQAGRFGDGAATNIGFATSRNAGRTWISGFLPRLSVHSRPAGTSARVADSAVAYDAAHRYWLVVSLGISESGGPTGADAQADPVDEDRLLVSRSTNGLRWSAPVVAAHAPEAFDKPWIACDNWVRSRFRGRCYLSYLDARTDLIMTARSNDGGRTWSAAVAHPPTDGHRFRNGAQPVVLPNGALVVMYSSFGALPGLEDHMASVRSTDGGATFSPERFVASIGRDSPLGLRTVSFPSVETDGAGRMYAVWQDCSAVDDCAANGVVMATSLDGLSWSGPTSVPTGRTNFSTEYLLPAIGVDRTTRGDRTRLTIAYYSLAPCRPAFCPGIRAAVVSSRSGGATWSAPQRVDTEEMPLAWLADSSFGRMLADYISVSYARGRAVPVLTLASPAAGAFRESIFATNRLPLASPSDITR